MPGIPAAGNREEECRREDIPAAQSVEKVAGHFFDRDPARRAQDLSAVCG